MNKSIKEIEELFGVSSKQLDEWERDATQGILPGEPSGKIEVGRPLKFGERLKFVGYRDTETYVEAADSVADELGISRSDYIRSLVHRDIDDRRKATVA